MTQTQSKSTAQVQFAAKSGLPTLEKIFLGLNILGLAIASYLSWTHLAAAPIICTPGGGCDAVNKSSYAYFPPDWGIPVAFIGLAGYIGMLALWLWRWRNPTLAGKLDMALFIATLVGFIFSGYLTAMELFVIHAVCWWCVASAIVVTVMFGIAAFKVWNAEPNF